MRIFAKLLLIAAGMTSQAVAQQPNVGIGVSADDYPFSSTANEGNLRGWGSLFRGMGNWLDSLGNYENLHEEARSKHIDNFDKGLHTKWRIQDEATARRRAAFESKYGLQAKYQRLSLIEATAEYRAKEDDLRRRGLLPAKGKPGFNYRGVRYPSYNAFKDTKEGQKFLAESWLKSQKNKAADLEAAEVRERAVAFGQDRRRYDASTIFWRDQNTLAERNGAAAMGAGWWLAYKQPEKYDEALKKELEHPNPLNPPYLRYEVKPFRK